MNKTDHDSRMMRTQRQSTVQGYNAQAAVTRGQIIVAAEITVDSPDFGHLEPVVNATLRELRDAGVTQRLETVLADAGYCHKEQIETIVSDGITVLVPPDGGLRKDIRPGWDTRMYSFMRRVLSSEAGHALYKHRKSTVEPVFTQIKSTARSPDSNAEVGPPSYPNGGWSPQRTTCSSVLSGDVVNAADGWPVSEAAVWSPSVVVANE